MMASLRKFSPFALIAGYIMLYYSTKGLNRIVPDLTGITFDKLKSKTDQFIIIAGAAIAMYALKHIKGIPASIRTVANVVLYFVIGYNLALAVDPPVNGIYQPRGRVTYVPPTSYNPYNYGG